MKNHLVNGILHYYMFISRWHSRFTKTSASANVSISSQIDMKFSGLRAHCLKVTVKSDK